MKECVMIIGICAVVLTGAFFMAGAIQDAKYEQCMTNFNDHKVCWLYARNR